MSKFAQIITSFERTGNFPIEANYIFPTVEDLKQFYSDPIQAVTLHKGLLKVVERDPNGKQALYWVTKKKTNDELEFTNLVAGQNIEEIQNSVTELLKKLETETNERKQADTAIWGVSDPSNIDEGYNSINDLTNQLKATQEALSTLREESVSGKDSLKNQLKATVGTTENDIIAYLNTLPYKSVTELANEVNRIVNSSSDTTESIDTLKELSEFLKGYTNKDTLKELLKKLWKDIQGEVLPSKPFRTLRGIEDYLIEYRTANDYKQDTLLEELNNIESAVGLNADGSYTPDSATNYLQNATSVMNALQILDKLLHKYVSANVPSIRNTDEAIKLSLTQELDSYVLAAALKLSTQAGNQLVKNTDGLYACAKTYYDKGILTFKVNDSIVSQHYIGMSAIVQSATYDKDNEQLVFVFKLASGDTQTVLVPVGALIREWDIENDDNSPIALNRAVDVSGTDKLSADVRLSTLPFNILVKDHNTLYVKGTSDNIYHDGVVLNDFLETLKKSADDSLETIRQTLESARLDRDSIKHSITAETDERQHADTELRKDITKLGSAIAEATTAITEEVTARKDANTVIKDQIRIEADRASKEETRLQMEIRTETERATQTESQQADLIQTLTKKVDEEAARSAAMDTAINQVIKGTIQPSLEECRSELDTKAPIDSPVLKGVPQIEIAPESNDSSQRIASTAWVQQHLQPIQQFIKEFASMQWVEVDDSFPDVNK